MDLKTYCKDIDITDRAFLREALDAFASGKNNKRSITRFFDTNTPDELISLAREAIKNREVSVGKIEYFERIEPINGKHRTIGREEPMHQFYDYIAVGGLMPMLNAKMGFYQCASVPGKGQALAHRAIKQWVRESTSRYFVKMDVKKYYPSIDRDVLMGMLRRDVGNDDLLYLVEYLIGRFDSGLNIGSYLSQYLANYYLSNAYHFATENLAKTKTSKRTGEPKRIRLLDHCLFYMDDVLFIGRSKRDLKMAARMFERHLASVLRIVIKPWKICLIKKEPIDMVGYVFRPHKTTIRAGIFIRARRAFARARQSQWITLHAAYRCIAYFGYLKHSDSVHFCRSNNISKTINECKDVVSLAMRERTYDARLLANAASRG